MHWHSYWHTSLQLIHQYDGSLPLAHYLKQYFAQHKKHGSRDRKWITHFCYCYYRTGHSFSGTDHETRMLASIFLATDSLNEMQNLFPENWQPAFAMKRGERILWLKDQLTFFNPAAIFPWKEQLSADIEIYKFSVSHLQQPDLFLRIRPGAEASVRKKLNDAGISYNMPEENCIALPNTTKADQIFALNTEVVVQDLSSQRTSALLKKAVFKKASRIWDACAASGGKSILVKDILGDIDLTVSDLRTSILQNLKNRFADAGISNYTSLVTDLSKAGTQRPPGKFDLIICDLPCSGSGTWGRTPEQLYFFRPEKIEEYATLQKKIIQQVTPHLKSGGYLLYMTCSVFAKENEQQIDAIIQDNAFILEEQKLYAGYSERADTLFGALIRKNE